MPIRWAPAAHRDLVDIIECLRARESGAVATRVGRKLLTAAESLAQLPRRCRVVPELKDLGLAEYRELLVDPYRIVFRVSGGVVGIVAVVDGRRDLDGLLLRRALGD